MTIQLTGMKDLKKKMSEGNLAVIEGARLAVRDLTTDVARKSSELVPFDTGNLARSIVIKYPQVLSDHPKGEVSYGGAAAPYAVVQHEAIHYWHPPKPPGNSSGKVGAGPVTPGTGRGPKYLEYPMKRLARDGFEKKLVQIINNKIKNFS